MEPQHKFICALPFSILLTYIILGKYNGYDAWGIFVVSGIIGWCVNIMVTIVWEIVANEKIKVMKWRDK